MMRRIYYKNLFLSGLFLWVTVFSFGQGKGSLFIIGGGVRSESLLKELINTAQFTSNDYIVILPMATSLPQESVASISGQLSSLCSNLITSFNFSKTAANENQAWLDSVRKAKLIYIVGGNQNKFMDVVRGTKLYTAIHEAFNTGATISGTSAGAAVMSEIMITGEERDTTDKGAFKEIMRGNVVTSQGLGLVTTAIIDQHFIKRSRYNRLISVLTDHPDKKVIGIDEGTAIIVSGKQARVVGQSQVVVITPPNKLKWSNEGKVAFRDAHISLFLSGDKFKMN